MKANAKQYKQAVKIYEQHGQTAVYQFAKEQGIDEWVECSECEDLTPSCNDSTCLVCGSLYNFQKASN